MDNGVNTLTGDTSLELVEFDSPPADPVELLRGWLSVASDYGVREPNAVVLATADESGHPSTRVLLLKEVDDRGLVFTSHRGSRKGREIAVNPWGSVAFYWRETLQQINVGGAVEMLSDEESDRLFDERPRDARATTAVSRQSEVLESEDGLRTAAGQLLEGGEAISRPSGWVGYRLIPQQIEFWYGNPDRLHRRLRYDREGAVWTVRRLYP